MENNTLSKNPIIGYYRGLPYRASNIVYLRVNICEYKKFIDAKLDFGYSQKEAIKKTNIMCEPCNGVSVKKNIDEKAH